MKKAKVMERISVSKRDMVYNYYILILLSIADFELDYFPLHLGKHKIIFKLDN